MALNDLVLLIDNNSEGWGFLYGLSFPSGMKFLNLDDWGWHSNGSHPYCGMWYTKKDSITERYMSNMLSVIEKETTRWKYSGHILDLDGRTNMNMTLWKVSNVRDEEQYVIAHKQAGAQYISELPILDTSTGEVKTLKIERLATLKEETFNPRKVTKEQAERIIETNGRKHR